MTSKTEQTAENQSSSAWKIIGVIFLILVLALAIGIWQVFTELFPGDFEPVTLSQEEERVLEQKLARIDPTRLQSAGVSTPMLEASSSHRPELGTEVGASDEITFTERELNAMLAKYSNNAHHVAIEFSDSLVDVRGLTPIEPDFPVIGGRTIEMILTFEVSLDKNRPTLFFKAAKIWGVNVPEAWIDDKTNTDMSKVFDFENNFWKAFGERVEKIAVSEGALQIQLKE